MSKRYKGGVISATAPTTSTSAATGVWTLTQQLQAIAGSGWPVYVAPGQQAYTTAGTYSWVAPAGVTSVSVVAVGAGGRSTTGPGGRGGGLGYKNNYSVTPGSSYTVVVGAATSGVGGDSYFINTSTVAGFGGGAGANGGTYFGDGGGNGGSGNSGGGGGAGGYSGAGGNGGSIGSTTGSSAGTAGTGGAGGGGGGGWGYGPGGSGTIFLYGSGGGGGVGILGQGTSGNGGSASSNQAGSGGTGGSGGANGNNGAGSGGGNAGAYGGGAGGLGGYYSGPCCCVFDSSPGASAGGAVRIIWPGNTRSFPSTNTGNL